MDLGLEGRRAAVAAASGGLGYGIAAALAAEGVTVAGCGRRADVLEEAMASIDGEAIPIVADVGTVEGARSFVREARDRLGGIDILVTNAGGPPPATAMSSDVDGYRDAFELNCASAIGMCLDVVPAMRAQRWGRVLAVTSIAVRQPIGALVYSNTARAALTGFLKSLATEVAPDGVTVNSIQPGSHDTPRLRQVYGDDLSAVAAAVPTGQVGDAADFGAVAAFLCSAPARFVTGAAIPVDGGAYAGLQ